MAGFEGIGKLLVIAGALLVITGLLLTFWQKLPLGKLPGDIIIIRKDDFSFFFPIVTFLIISLVLTIVLNLVFRLFK